MFCFENGAGFKPKPNVCVRDTKVRKYLGFGYTSYNCWEVVEAVYGYERASAELIRSVIERDCVGHDLARQSHAFIKLRWGIYSITR